MPTTLRNAVLTIRVQTYSLDDRPKFSFALQVPKFIRGMSLKRKSLENGRGKGSSVEEEESEFELESLDAELSSDEESTEEGEEADNESEENVGDEGEGDDDEISVAGNAPNGKENGIDGAESEDLLSDVSSEYESSDSEVVLDADGNPRRLLPEIDPHYDSDSSTPEETNTIGDIDVEKYYGSMPHIGYDINGRRIMRPAAGAALDQLLETIDLPKGWTGIVDKETGELKNLTDEELEIIKRIRREELPNDQIDIFDVSSHSNHTNLAVSLSKRRSLSVIRRPRTKTTFLTF